VNSPAAAVQGSVDALEETVRRFERCGRDLQDLALPPAALARYFRMVEGLLPTFANLMLPSPVEARQIGRRLRATLSATKGGDVGAAALAELGADGERLATDILEIGGKGNVAPLCGYLRELAFLMRAAATIRTAIQSIRRIVGALRRYSRLDEAPVERVDLHAGIEDTLVILAHQLKSSENGISVKRAYGKIPPISAYVGELNQVWTNLIHNSIQAMNEATTSKSGGKSDGGGGGEILIETSVKGADVEVAIEDNGPGIPPDLMSRIFDPFFTTKEKGEGTGLGLSIAHKIVDKHGGSIRVESIPGRTRFEVLLPLQGPAAAIPVLRRRTGSSSGRGIATGEGDAPGSGQQEAREQAGHHQKTNEASADVGTQAGTQGAAPVGLENGQRGQDRD
jgi:signal transduction histidine kinase